MLNLSIILSLFLIFLGGIQCQAPSNVTFASEFPNWPLNITVTPSTAGIFQYRAFILPQSEEGCFGLYSFKCSNCTGVGGTAGATDTANCPALINLGSYNSTDSAPFTMAITYPPLLPVVAISIKVEAQNATRYSTSGRQNFTLAAFKSGPVRNATVNSTNFIFTTPAVENGKVQEYILYVRKTTGDCIFTMTFNCTQCTATPGKKNIAFNTSLCSVKKVSQFLGNETLITSTYTLTEPVINCFTVCIVAVNAYGWGEVGCSCIDTSIAPTTTTAFVTKCPITGEQVRQTLGIDLSMNCIFSYKQVPLLLPPRPCNDTGDITRIYLVVVKMPTNITDSPLELPIDNFVGKTWTECQGKTNQCTYEIDLLTPLSLNFSDVSVFKLGSNLPSCVNRNFSCNGPLEPSSTYRIALRIYTRSSFITMGWVNKNTTSEQCRIASIIGIFFGAFGFTLLITLVIVFVAVRRQIGW